MNRRTLWNNRIWVVALVLGLLVAACASDDSRTTETTSTPQQTSPEDTAAGASGAAGANVVLLTVTEECEYCALHLRKFREVAEAAGINLDVKITNFDPAEQATQVDQALSQNPDLIVLWPADASALIPSINKIRDAGIPLVVSNSKPEVAEPLWDVYTGPDDYGNGVTAARAMIQGFEELGFGDSGTVFVVVGVLGTPPQIQRLAGFKDTLAAEAPGIEVVADQPGNWDQTQATEAAAALFTQFPDIDGVYAQADNMLAGVIVAAQRADIDPASIVLVGSNCSIEGVTAMEAGTQYASVLQSPIEDGRLAAEAAVSLLNGETVEQTIFITPELITKDNTTDCYAAIGR